MAILGVGVWTIFAWKGGNGRYWRTSHLKWEGLKKFSHVCSLVVVFCKMILNSKITFIVKTFIGAYSDINDWSGWLSMSSRKFLISDIEACFVISFKCFARSSFLYSTIMKVVNEIHVCIGWQIHQGLR